MTLQGKGFFTLHLSNCEGGNPAAILSKAHAAGLSHILIRIADGTTAWSEPSTETDADAVIVQALHLAGIDVWGWHTPSGKDPDAEAALVTSQVQALHLDGLVVDAGEEFQRPGMDTVARRFMSTLRASLKMPIGLSSFRFPQFHPHFPWSTFLEFSDLHLPKVYWEQDHNAGEQLRESKRQCDALPNARPCIPTGGIYRAPGWAPSTTEIADFLQTAKALNLPGVNFFSWDSCSNTLPYLWNTIAGFSWPQASMHDSLPVADTLPAPETHSDASQDAFTLAYMGALNSRQAGQMIHFYDPQAIQVWADQILRGLAEIQTVFSTFFSKLPAGLNFTLSQARNENDQYLLTWQVGTLSGESTLVIKGGKIALEYTILLGQ